MLHKKTTANVNNWNSKFRGFGPVMRKLAGATLEGVAPGIKGAVTSTVDVMKDSRTFIMGSKSQVKQQAKTLATTMVGRDAMDTINSAVSDLKNGSFSMDKLSDSSYDMADDFADSMDFDYDKSDPSSAVLAESKKSTAVLGHAISQGSAATITGMQQMTETLANVQIKASNASTKQLTNVALIGLNQTSSQLIGINNRLDAINQNIISLLDFHENNTAILNQQASTYYTQSTEMMNSIGEALSGIKDFIESAKNMSDEKDPEWDEFDFSSGFNMHSYKEMIKKNVKNSTAWTMLEMGKTMFGMSSMMGETPFEMGLPSIMSKIIPKNIRNSLTRTDKMFNQTVNNILYRLGDMADSDDFFKSALGSIFGKKREKAQTKLKMGDFKKTAMSWNGIAQQTLVEVIPSYLARIESGINKSELRYYNMDSGRFDTMSNIKKKYEKEYTDTIELGMSSYATKLNELLEKSGSTSKEKVTSAQQQINDLVMAQLRGDAGAKSRHETEKEVFRIQKEAGLSGNALRDAMVEFNDAMNSTLKSVNETVKNLNTASRHMFNTEGVELDAVVRNANIFSDRKFVGGRALEDLDEEERLELERAERNSKGFMDRVKNFFSGTGSSGGGMFSRTARNMDNFANSQYDFWNNYDSSENEGGIRSNQSTITSSTPATSQATVNTSQTQGERRINREVTRTTEAGLTDSLNANQNQIEANANRTARIIHDLENTQSPDDDKNSIKAMVLSLHHNFLSPMVNGIFGKNGIIRSFFRDILNTEHVKKIRDKLFDEETGLFGGVTVWFKDQMKYLKYTFNGEGYTDSKGNVFDEKDDSVFDRIATGYDKIRRLAFTHWFGEDFEENETYKKYLGWTDFKKKREDKRAARIASQNKEDESGNNEIKEDKSSEAKIDLRGKYNESWNKLEPMQQAQLYGGDIDSFIQEEEAKLQEGTQTVSGQLKSLAESVAQVSGEVVDKVRNNVDRVVGNITDSEVQKAQEEQNKSIREKIKGFLPVGLTGATVGAAVGTLSGSGLIASAFLPGGPISGAIAGIGISMLTRSDKFKDFLFGKEDENGEKTGGLISQRTQKFFKDNAPAIAAGAVMGTIKGALGIGGGGLLGTLFAGPVGGALLGMGFSLVKKSETFQKMLFGKEDDDGKRIGGLLNKENGKLTKAFEKSGGFVKGGLKGLGIGAMTGLALGKMGFVGSALSVGGPVGMGLMGLGLGIASQTEKFKNVLFGEEEFDKDGNPIGRKKNGLLYKVRNNLVLHVFEPVKDKLQEETAKFGVFLAKNIKKPFKLAFGPLIHSMKDLKDDIAESVRAAFEKVGNTITSIFKNTVGKMFSPVIKAMGFVAKHTVRLPFDAMKLSLMPLSGALKLASLATRKKRWAAKRKEHASILSTPVQLVRGAIGKVKEQSEAYDQNEFSGRLGKLNKGLTMVKDFKKGLRDSYASEMEKYEEGKNVSGENTFGYLSAKREAKEAKERFKNFKRDSKTQKKIRDVRMAYAERFKKGEVSLNDDELEVAKKRLEKAGLDPSWIKNNKDLNDLIYNRDDFYDKFNPNAKKKKDSRTFEEEVREDGVKIQETPDQVQDRERQKNFFQFMQDAVSPIRDHFKKKNEEDENTDNSTDEAILGTLQNIEQSSQANAVMNTIEQGKETGATDGQLRDAAGSRISNLANDIMDHDKNRQEDEKRDAKEAEESKRAKMGGVSTQELEEERQEKRKAKISGMKDKDDDAKERKTIFGGIKDFIFGGLGLFGKIFKSKTLWKVALGSLTTYGLFGEEINKIFTNTLKPWWTETAWPFLQTSVFPKLGGFFDKAVDFVVEKLPDIATKVTQRVIDNMDTFVNAAWNIVKATIGTIGGNIGSWFKKKIGLGDDEGKEVQFSSNKKALKFMNEKNPNGYESIDETGEIKLKSGYDIRKNENDEMASELIGAKGYDGYYDENGNFQQAGKISTFKGDAASTAASIGRAGFFRSRGVTDVTSKLADKIGRDRLVRVGKFLGKGAWKGSKLIVGGLSHIPFVKWPAKVVKGLMNMGEGIVTGKSGKALSKTGKAAINGTKKAGSFFNKLLKNGATDTAEAVVEDVVEKGAKEGTEAIVKGVTSETAKESASKIGKEIAETAVDHVDDVAKNKGVIKTLIEKVKTGILKLKDKVADPLKKLGVKPDEWGKVIIKFFDDIAQKLLKSNIKLLKKIGGKIAEKTAEATARTGASATIVAQIGLSIFDGVDGALSASHLFKVPESEVDFGMRTISSIMNIILGLGPVAYIDILLEVLRMLNILDLKGMLARWLYSKLGGKNHLEEADKEMDALTAKYNKTFGTQLTKEEFNDKANSNKGVLGRAGQFFNWAGNGIASLWRSDEEKAKAERDYQKKYHADKLAEWTKEEEAKYEAYKKKAGNKALDKSDWYTETDGGTKSIGNGPGANKISSMQHTLGYGTTMQNDPRWANIPIGKFPNGTTSTMATGGCGPTALSMISGGTNPAAVAEYANKKGYIRDGGATADLFTKGASELGLHAKKETSSSIKDSLKSGKPVVISGKSRMDGPYTEAGHIIVASGIDNNDNVQIKDPMRGTRVESLSSLTSGMTNSWSYNKDNGRFLAKGGKPIGFGPKNNFATKRWFEYNGKKYVIDDTTSTIMYIEVSKKDEGQLQDTKRFLGNDLNQLAPQPFLNYLNGISYENGTPDLNSKFSVSASKNRKVVVKTASGKDLVPAKNDFLPAKSSKTTSSSNNGSIAAGVNILGNALGRSISMATSKARGSNQYVPDMQTLMSQVADPLGPMGWYYSGIKAPKLPGATPMSVNDTPDDIKRRIDAEKKIRSGYLKENDEYKFNTPKFYEGMNITTLKTMVEVQPSLIKDVKIPFFKKVYDEFVVTGDYSDNHTITVKEVENIQGRHKLSEILGGFGTYGSYEYKNGFPFFQTDDPRWAGIPWRGATVQKRGGDLASLAMVTTAFGPNVITPDYINTHWLNGKYANWTNTSEGLNQDVIFADGGFNALKETQVDGKRLTVKKLENDGSILTAIGNGKPVVITGYRYNGSIFGGYYDKVQKGSDKNPVLAPTQVNIADPDAYSTLVAVGREGDYFAVNDPFTTLEQPSVFNINRITDKLGNGTKAYKSAYSIAGPNGEGLSLPVDFSNKEGGVSDYEDISEAQGLGGKIGAIFNNMKAVFEHMFEALTGGTAYKSIKEVNEIEGAGEDDFGVGYNSLGKAITTTSGDTSYILKESILKSNTKKELIKKKNTGVKMDYRQALKKYKIPMSVRKGQVLKKLLDGVRSYERYKNQPDTAGYQEYVEFNDSIVLFCEKYNESKSGAIKSGAAKDIIKSTNPNTTTSDGKNIGILHNTPMSLGYGIGTGSKLSLVSGSAFNQFSQIAKSVANQKPGNTYPTNQGVVGTKKTLSGATVSSDGTATTTPVQTTYYTNATEQKLDVSKATWADKMEAIGFATTAQMMGEDYETAKYNYLAQKVGESSGSNEGSGNIANSAAMVNPSDESGYIWNELIKNNATPQGAAGVMGNFEKESGNHAVRMQGDYKHSDPNKASQDYTNKADQDPASFISDRVGYGLAQWTSSGRKEGLINLAKSRGTSVGDIASQIAWFMEELRTGYKNVYQTITSTSSIADASNIMLHKFEMPKDQSTREENERIGYANAYFEKFAKSGNNSSAQVSYGPGNKYKFKIPKSIGFGRGAIGYGASWISIVQAVKQAIAAQQPGYSQSRSITIDVGGIPKSVRTDCSGFVSACISYYTGQDFQTNSTGFLSSNISVLQNAGFQYMPWPGWEGLVPGDIIAISGHVEIFAGNEGGTHMVYNCGSDSSTNNPGITKSSRSGYTSIWRSPEAGSAVLNSTNSGAVNNTTTAGGDATGSTSGNRPIAATGLDMLFASMNEMGGVFNKSFLGFGPGPRKSEKTPEGYFTKTLGGIVTSKYGHRSSSLGNEFHRGLDIGAPYGTSIKSPINGKVVSTGSDAAGYGNYAVVQDEEGTKHLFGHMQNPVGYGPGTQIYKDSVIGQVGSSGKSTGSHLHYEMRRNDSKYSTIDPDSYKYDTKGSYGNSMEEEIGYGGGNMNTATSVKEKLTVALNTKNIETKMDTLIDVMRTWAERDEANSKSMTLNNVTNNTEVSYGTGSNKPVVKKTSQTSTAPKGNLSKMSLADIHKSIASKK